MFWKQGILGWNPGSRDTHHSLWKAKGKVVTICPLESAMRSKGFAHETFVKSLNLVGKASSCPEVPPAHHSTTTHPRLSACQTEI